MTWDILICAMTHRYGKLERLLNCLEPQIVDGVGVLVFYDNLETPWVDKCNALIAASRAEYVSHIDDDDQVSPNYVWSVAQAFAEKPDYVGFNVRWTEDGVQQLPVKHSLRFHRWSDMPDCLYRDVTDKNPIKREIALKYHWSGGNGADRAYADQLRGFVHTEVYIPRELYYYQHESGDTFTTPRQPMTRPPAPPHRDWVTYL